MYTEELNRELIEAFLANTPRYARALEGYERHDNGMLLACVDEIVENVARGEDVPARLATPAMGQFESGAADDDLVNVA